MGSALAALDYCVLVAYFAVMLGVATHARKKANSLEGYFLGGRALPGWAVGLSLLASAMSSVTFLAYPATAYLLDYRLAPKDVFYPMALLLSALFVAPKFVTLGQASAFEALEVRFGVLPRAYAAAAYCLAVVLKLSSVLYLCSLVLQRIIHVSPQVAVVVTGAFVAAYSVSGGLVGVVWTDTLQAVTLMLSGILLAAVAAAKVPGGGAAIWAAAAAEHKLRWAAPGPAFAWDHRALITVLCYGFTHYCGRIFSYQDVFQRYLAVRERDLQASLLWAGLLAFPTWLLFYWVGTSVWAFMQLPEHAHLREAMLGADDCVPTFILAELPMGARGFVISGVLAAAMSTVDSALNAVSSVAVNDFLRRFAAKGKSEEWYLWAGKTVSVVTAAVCIGVALGLLSLPKESMNDLINALDSLTQGPVLGLFVGAMFVPALSRPAALCGLCAAMLANLLLACLTRWVADPPLHSYWCGTLVNATFAAAALAAELALRRRRRALQYARLDEGGAASQEPEGVELAACEDPPGSAPSTAL